MKNLEEEALHDAIFKQSETFIPDDEELQAHIKGFIAGATSDYAKEQIILGQIEVLERLEENASIMFCSAPVMQVIKNEIQELKAKLK